MRGQLGSCGLDGGESRGAEKALTIGAPMCLEVAGMPSQDGRGGLVDGRGDVAQVKLGGGQRWERGMEEYGMRMRVHRVREKLRWGSVRVPR